MTIEENIELWFNDPNLTIEENIELWFNALNSFFGNRLFTTEEEEKRHIQETIEKIDRGLIEDIRKFIEEKNI